jgi:hypothetical protein
MGSLTSNLKSNYEDFVVLMDNSKSLYDILKLIQNRKDIIIEEKYTSDKEILIGVDYRL